MGWPSFYDVSLLDMLMLGHRDVDHVCGAATLLQALPASEQRRSREPGHGLLRAGPAEVRGDAGQNTSWDGLRFEVLHPLALHDQEGLNPNNLSCVQRIRAASGQRALLTSDLEA